MEKTRQYTTVINRFQMLRWLFLLGLILPLPLRAEDVIALPSGQKVTLIEVMTNVPGNDGIAIRYRFLAPAIARAGGTVNGDKAGTDMEWLCNKYMRCPACPRTVRNRWRSSSRCRIRTCPLANLTRRPRNSSTPMPFPKAVVSGRCIK